MPAKRYERCLEIRVFDILPTEDKKGEKVVRGYVVCNIESTKLPPNKDMQRLAHKIKILFAKSTKRAERKQKYCLEVRIVDGLPTADMVGRKVTRRRIECDIELVKPPSDSDVQTVAFEIKMLLAKFQRGR